MRQSAVTGQTPRASAAAPTTSRTARTGARTAAASHHFDPLDHGVDPLEERKLLTCQDSIDALLRLKAALVTVGIRNVVMTGVVARISLRKRHPHFDVPVLTVAAAALIKCHWPK